MFGILQNLNSISTIIAIIVPGFISIFTYHFLTPRKLDWKSLPFEASAYGYIALALHHSLTLHTFLSQEHFDFTIIPISIAIGLTPFILRKIPFIKKFARHPCCSAWNFAFEKAIKTDFFIIVTLRSGQKIAGYMGDMSFISPSTDSGDIFIQWEYKIDDDGDIGTLKKGTKGVLISKEDCSYIEFFNKGGDDE